MLKTYKNETRELTKIVHAFNTPTHLHKSRMVEILLLWQSEHMSKCGYSSSFERSGQLNPVNTEG